MEDDPLIPLYSVRTGEVIRGLPDKVGGITTLTGVFVCSFFLLIGHDADGRAGQECDAILRELGLPEEGTVVGKRRLIWLKLGLTILTTS